MIKMHTRKDKSFEFSVVSETGSTLLKSITFEDKNAVDGAIKEFNKPKEIAKRVERKTDLNGKFLFNVKDTKGYVIAYSGLYGSEAGMENGIQTLHQHLKP